MTVFKTYLFILGVLFFQSASAQTVQIFQGFEQVSIGQGLNYLVDADGQMTLEDVIYADSWQVNRQETLNLGFTDAVYWLQFVIENDVDVQQSLILEVKYPLLDEVNVYVGQQEGFKHFLMGESVPFGTRYLAHSNFIVPIDLLGNQFIPVYLRIESASSMQVPLDLWKLERFIEYNYQISSLMGVFYGLLLAVALYHLIIYFTIKESSFLHYALFNASILAIFLCVKGIPNTLFWIDSFSITDSMLLLSLCGAVCFVSLFSSEILLMKEARPGMDRCLQLMAVSALVLGVVSLALPYQVAIQLVLLTAVLGVLINGVAHVARFFDGYPPARYIVFAGLFSANGVLISIAEKAGWLPHSTWMENAAYTGVVIMSLLYAFALSYRMNMDKSLRERTQRKLLETQARLNIDLDHRIAERTREKEKMALLLKTTKALSASDDKLTAAKIAVRHIKTMLPDLRLTNAVLYLNQKSSKGYTAYQLWCEAKEQEPVLPEEVHDELAEYFNQLTAISLVDEQLLIPVRSEKQALAFLTLTALRLNNRNEQFDGDLLGNVAHSLALAIEGIEAEENNRLASIGAMSAAIVHDLKNPIGAIKHCAEFAALDETPRHERQDYLQCIVEEANRMSLMAHEVLEFSRNEIQLTRSLLLAAELLIDFSQIAEQTLKPAGILYNSQNKVEGFVYVDVDRLHRVLLNLITNARDAMLDGQTLNPAFSITLSANRKDLVITVSDNGPGIPDNIRPILFEPFVTHGKPDGTGLGMAIVKKTIDAHGGDICFNTSTKGTVFTIVLYDAITQQLSATSLDSKQLATAFDVSGMRVLVAEDNPVNQKIIAKLLRDMKLDVTLVENGALAVEAVRQSIATQAQDYAAVLLDIEMPVLDGIAAAMNIKQLLGDHAPQLIALTAHAAQENSHRFREAGFSFILEKPVSRELLQETLYQAFLAQLDSVSG